MLTFTRNPNLQQNTPVLDDLAGTKATATTTKATSTTTATATSTSTGTGTKKTGSGGRELLGEQEWVVNLRGDCERLVGSGRVEGEWFSGRRPWECAGYDMETQTLHSVAQPHYRADGGNRERLRAYVDNTWTLTEVLFTSVCAEEGFYRPPYHQLRHPLVFYLCHPAALYVNKLRVAGLLHHPLHPYFEEIFETGVDEMSWDDLSKNAMRWPSLHDALAYRRSVYALITRCLFDTPLELEADPVTAADARLVWWLAAEHERIHIETSSLLLRELPIRLVQFPKYWPKYHPHAYLSHPKVPTPGKDYPLNPMISVPGGKVTIGKPADFPSFGWDNEYGQRTFDVRPFKASKFLVSNGQFLEFVKDGGYRTQKYWTKDGWGWRSFRNAKWPTFWVLDGPAGLHQYKLRLCFDIVEMPWSFPVDVNYHEAKAFCSWYTEKTKSNVPYYITTEPQHHMLRDDFTRDESLGIARDPIMTTDGKDMPTKHNININLAYGSQSPVDAFAPNSKGFHDVFGNAWQWCEDYFCALEGFKPHFLYDDFSTPCFDGEHNIIMGGSFVSTGDEASIFARFHFRPHFFQHSSFRLVCPDDGNPERDITSCTNCPPPHVKDLPWGTSKTSTQTTSTTTSSTASKEILNTYMDLHYGQDALNDVYLFSPMEAVNYPVRLIERIRQVISDTGSNTKNALDVGCGVGRMSFILSEVFDEVLGIDNNQAFIQIASKLQKGINVNYERISDGDLVHRATASLPEQAQPQKVKFETRDAAELPRGPFDLLLFSNVLCQTDRYREILEQLVGESDLVSPGGLVVVVSPFTSIDAKDSNTHPVRSLEDITSYLDQSYTKVHESSIPMLLREHSRKFSYYVCSLTIFKKDASQ